nr:4-(cytidine 5'-diphospho)-2-C-methyl-D-erythritol kinase [uncultured Roseateles sp.]
MLALYDVAAPAKLNLFLHVVGRRADGYHLLQSVFVLIDWCDTLHFERRGDGRLARHDLTEPLPADDLCLRAARALQTASGCSFGADIHIAKQVPSGAGMGGGSSDAASTLLALNRLWGLNWPLSRLLPLGLSLGADVPFFLGGRPAFVEGIGEILTPLQLPAQQFAVLKPQVSLPTSQIFSSPLLARDTPAVIVAGFPADTSSERLKKVSDEITEITTTMIAQGFGHNDLQPPAESQCAEVVEALELLKARFGDSRMTGSGSAVFARMNEIQGTSESPKIPEDLPPGWAGRMCRSLELHPLVGWAAD